MSNAHFSNFFIILAYISLILEQKYCFKDLNYDCIQKRKQDEITRNFDHLYQYVIFIFFFVLTFLVNQFFNDQSHLSHHLSLFSALYH